MRYLGIDYGSKRIGVAVSDPSKTFATPLSVLRNSSDLLPELGRICKDHDIEAVVVGESKDFSLRDNYIMKEIRPFVESLKNSLKLPVYLYPEFMTSSEAEHIQGRNEMHDASAAALILKHYLDTHPSTKPH